MSVFIHKCSIFIIIIFLKTVCNCEGQILCIRELEIRDSVFYYNQKKYTGEYLCVDDKGRTALKGFIKEGSLDSLSFVYDEYGQLKAKFQYKEGKVVRSMNCTVGMLYKTCETYKGDVLDGVWEKYFINGTIKERRYYEKGEPSGKWTIWDKKGIPFVETTFVGDTIIQITHQYTKKKHIILTEKSLKKRPFIIKRERKVENLAPR
jgi:antitoxin component YwqK of YwqJK toxin-antitoxin module